MITNKQTQNYLKYGKLYGKRNETKNKLNYVIQAQPLMYTPLLISKLILTDTNTNTNKNTYTDTNIDTDTNTNSASYL